MKPMKGVKMISPQTLKFYQLFADQDAEMLMQIAILAEEKIVEAGHQLWEEGDVAKSLFLVLEGSVVLAINLGDRDTKKVEELEPLGKGELVGWSSIVKPHIYKMSARTGEKTRLLAFNGEKLCNLFDDHPSFGYYFMQKLAEIIAERYISKCVQLISLVK
jgi:CRP/FNR family transcriptional regulator, cyclic AMP receptor protein